MPIIEKQEKWIKLWKDHKLEPNKTPKVDKKIHGFSFG